jgi:hypothetical protein
MKPRNTMKQRINKTLIFAMLFSLALVGCQRISQQPDSAADVTIVLSVQPDPPGVGPSRLTITLADAGGAPIEDAHLQIKGDMTHAGMQPVLAEVREGAGGRYETPFEWTMGGDWIVTVSASLPDGRSTSRQFNLTVTGDTTGMPMNTMPGESQ